MKINRTIYLLLLATIALTQQTIGIASPKCKVVPVRWHVQQYSPSYTVITVYAWLDETFIDGLTFTSDETGRWVTSADPANEFEQCVDGYAAFLDHSIIQLSTLQSPQPPFQNLTEFNRFLRTINPYQTYFPAVYQDG